MSSLPCQRVSFSRRFAEIRHDKDASAASSAEIHERFSEREKEKGREMERERELILLSAAIFSPINSDYRCTSAFQTSFFIKIIFIALNESPTPSYYCFHHDNSLLPAACQKTLQVKSPLCLFESAPEKRDKNYLYERQSSPVIVPRLLFLTSGDISKRRITPNISLAFSRVIPRSSSRKNELEMNLFSPIKP